MTLITKSKLAYLKSNLNDYKKVLDTDTNQTGVGICI